MKFLPIDEQLYPSFDYPLIGQSVDPTQPLLTFGDRVCPQGAQYAIARDDDLGMQLQPLLLNGFEGSCGALEIAVACDN